MALMHKLGHREDKDVVQERIPSEGEEGEEERKKKNPPSFHFSLLSSPSFFLSASKF